MPKPLQLHSGLRVRRDDFSVQVSCDDDQKFWFRLESTDGADLVTDFTIGSFDSKLGGDLLAMCFDKIGRPPLSRLVFVDIVPSQRGDPIKIAEAQSCLEEYAAVTFARHNRSIKLARIEARQAKLDLIIETEPDRKIPKRD
jgi:hypothetical protein